MNILHFLKKFTTSFLILIIGILVGGYLFSGVEPRSFLSFHKCEERCLESRELLGLLGSVGIQKFGKVLPLIVAETDKSIAIQHPFPESRIHYVVVPKKDIKNIGETGAGDESYLNDAFAIISHLVRQEGLSKYKIITNGPGYQSVAYLHFHLIAK